MANATNTGSLIGRFASDPRAFQNADGSKKVVATLYVDRPYRTRDGKTISDQISVEAWVSNQVDGLGPYAYVHKGDLVALSTHIEQLPYTGKNNETVFPPAKIVVDQITFLESRGTTQGRLAKRAVTQEGPAVQAGPAAEAAPVAEGASAYDNEMPFAEANG